jgi:hypothetical protein
VAEVAQLHVLTVSGCSDIRDANTARLANAGACIHDQHEPPSSQGLMRNWLTVLTCAQARPQPWTVILQDDAELLPGWQRHLPLALAYSPRALLGLTCFGGYGKAAADAGYAYAVGRNLVWGTAHAIRTELVQALEDFSRYCLTLDPAYPHDDNLIALFGREAGTALAARALFGHLSVPSLVGHGGASAGGHYSGGQHRYPTLTITGKGPAWSTPGYYTLNAALTPPVTRRLITMLDTHATIGSGTST